MFQSTGDDLRLVTVVAQAGDLAQPQLALEEAHRLLMQVIAHPVSVEPGAATHESSLVDTPGLAGAIGKDVEALVDHLVEQLGAPAAAVEHDRYSPLADHAAHLA